MVDFDPNRKFGKRSGGKRSGRKRSRSFGRDDSDDRGSRRFDRRGPKRSSLEKEMHKVTCDNCGKECEVPFKPTSGKPVYCQDCFGKHDDRGSGRSAPQSSEELEKINKKLDKIMKALKID